MVTNETWLMWPCLNGADEKWGVFFRGIPRTECKKSPGYCSMAIASFAQKVQTIRKKLQKFMIRIRIKIVMLRNIMVLIPPSLLSPCPALFQACRALPSCSIKEAPRRGLRASVWALSLYRLWSIAEKAGEPLSGRLARPESRPVRHCGGQCKRP